MRRPPNVLGQMVLFVLAVGLLGARNCDGQGALSLIQVGIDDVSAQDTTQQASIDTLVDDICLAYAVRGAVPTIACP